MRKTLFIIISLFIIAISSCAKPNATENDSIDGTWKHTAVSKTADGERQPLTKSDVSWTFRQDGTGTYTQIVKDEKDSPANGTNEFKWKIEGDDLFLTPVKTGRELKYTIAKRSAGEMVWKTYITGDFYIVKKD